MAKNSIFINHEKIVGIIREYGEANWDKFNVSELVLSGNAKKCDILADGKNATLLFYSRRDGSTTVTPTGKNTEISENIKEMLESNCKYSGKVDAKCYTIKKVSKVWSEGLIEYLKEIEGVTFELIEKNNPPLNRYVFKSEIGDKITINLYKNGTLSIQGKPALLYEDCISYLSYCDEVTVNDIIKSTNEFHESDVEIKDVKYSIKELMPFSHDKIDNTIIKLISPSLVLKRINIELEDYTCYVFPVLRAMEGFIKLLLANKSISTCKESGKESFYGIFNLYSICDDKAKIINDSKYIAVLEELYRYFKDNRHNRFHTNQIIESTTIIESKVEADTIINESISLIENSYKKISTI